MKKPTYTVVIKKKPKIPKELLVYFTPETKVELIKDGYAKGYSPTTIVKPCGKK